MNNYPSLRKCLCVNVRWACITISTLGIFGIWSFFRMSFVYDQYYAAYFNYDWEFTFLVLCVLYAGFCALLFAGALQENSFAVIAYVYATVILVIIQTCLSFMIIIYNAKKIKYIGFSIIWTILCLPMFFVFTMVANGYAKNLQQRNARAPPKKPSPPAGVDLSEHSTSLAT